MINSHELVLKRNIFYYRAMHYQIAITLCLLLGIVLNLFFIKKIRENYIKPVYFPTSDYGLVIKDVPITEQIYRDDQVIAWTEKHIQELFELDFVNYKSKLRAVQPNFHPQGYNSFLSALKNSRNMMSIVNKKYLVRVSFKEPSMITTKGIMLSKKQPRYRWVISGKMTLYYLNDQNVMNPFIQEIDFLTLIVRESFYEFSNGLSVAIVIGK